MKNYLTYSKIDTYVQCPFKYKWIYIDRNDYKRNIASERGIFARAVLERYVTKLMELKKKKNLKVFDKIFNTLWSDTYGIILSDYDKHKIKDYLLVYIQKSIEIKHVLAVECQFSFYLAELKLQVSGRFNRVESLPVNRLKLIDYKIGQSQFFFSDSLQSWIYGYALLDRFPEYGGHQISYRFLEKNEFMGFKPQDKSKLKSKIIGVASSVLSDCQMLPTKNKWCDFCDICEQGKCSEWN